MPNDLSPDLARKIEELRGRVVPDGPAPTGSSLRVTGQAPFRYGWSSEPPSRVLEYHGDPNGELNARKGVLCTDVDTPALYQNQDGADTWTPVGGGSANGASGFYGTGSPVVTSVPDGTETALEWPTFSFGTDLLDLSDPTVPTVLATGAYAIEATVQGASAFSLQVPILVVDTGASYFAGTTDTRADGESHTYSCIAFLHAGSTVEVHALQDTGSSKDVSVLGVNVTRIA